MRGCRATATAARCGTCCRTRPPRGFIASHRRLGEHAPTQDEMIQLLGQLHATDLLQSDVTPDVAELFSRGEREDRARYRRSFANPMALRFPLWDPDAFLNRFERWPRRIW